MRLAEAQAAMRARNVCKEQRKRMRKPTQRDHPEWPLRLLKSKQRQFWAKVLKAGPDECWLWVGARAAHGYGQFTVTDGLCIMAHRYAWELTHGMFPCEAELGGKSQIHHTCKNKACVNPAHLHLITAAEHRRLHVVENRK